MKKFPVPPMLPMSDKEAEDFEQRIREAHNQFEGDDEYEEPLKKEGVNQSWLEKKPPGILKALIPKLLPPRPSHKKRKF